MYGRIKLFNAFIFVAFGIFIGVQMFRIAGLHAAALSGYLLAAAMIGLGIYRIWSARRQHPA